MILCSCGLLKCGSADSCYGGNEGAVYQVVFGKPVLNVRVNLHKYKMTLLLVWDPKLCDESRSIEHFHDHCNIFVFSRSGDQVSSCVIEKLKQDRCRGCDVLQDIREAFEPCAIHIAGYSRNVAQLV